jgi:hypothetical protein
MILQTILNLAPPLARLLTRPKRLPPSTVNLCHTQCNLNHHGPLSSSQGLAILPCTDISLSNKRRSLLSILSNNQTPNNLRNGRRINKCSLMRSNNSNTWRQLSLLA